jgi:hypothetical protein
MAVSLGWHRLRWPRCLGAFAVLLHAGALSAAGDEGLWRLAAERDLASAYALVSGNHPAAVPALGDVDFRRRLDEGHRVAREFAAQAASFAGYRAALLCFANSFADRHIWSRDLYVPRTVRWPGFLAVRQEGWTVFARDEADPAAPPIGSRIVSCDGRPVDALAEASYGRFDIDWSVEAQRIKRSPWLFVDVGNPHVKPAARCTFRTDGAERQQELRWRDIARPDLIELLVKARTFGQAGMGVRPFAGGYWIAFESLDDSAQAVMEQVKAAGEPLRTSPTIVIDLRGNGGGNSAWGNALARALAGDATVDAVTPARSPGGEHAYWRASADNLATIDAYIERFTRELSADSELVRELVVVRKHLAAALAAGEPLAPRFTPGQAAVQRAAGPSGPRSDTRFVLVTDAACFSSCLLVADLFRRLGALHVGHATDANTNYMEVREIVLPSGLSTFSTLQKVDLREPFRIGPFVPHRIYEGDIAATAALETWVTSLRTGTGRSTGRP